MTYNTGFKPTGAYPTARQLEWMSREKIVFFHFGINTFTDKEWGDGTEDISIFNPEKLDCRQWIETIKKAGFTTAILTAKHHDGFCLWPSKYTEFSIKNTPYKNGEGDIVREFTQACEECGIKAGLYLSPWDRNYPEWGTEAYNDYYADQLTELMTNYGKIWECWWDGAGSDKANYDWGRWAYIVRNYQPDCAIFGSHKMRYADCRWVGNENGIAGDDCWSEIELTGAKEESSQKLNNGDMYGSRFIPAEADVSIRPGWFYHEFQDKYVKTSQQLLHLWFNSCAKNAFILLNIPPNRDGLLAEADVKSMVEFGEKLQSIFETNIALTADITSDSEYSGEYAIENILPNCDNKFYAAGNETPTIKITFDTPQKINCFSISEVIDYGHRVREYVITVHTTDGTRIIKHGQCIGYRRAEIFDTVDAESVEIQILKADAPPLLKNLGLYYTDEVIEDSGLKYESTGNLLEMPGAAVTYTDNEIIMDLGGTFPYNTVKFKSDKIKKYEINAFNGCIYDKQYEADVTGETQTAIFPCISYSYRLKITVLEGEVTENAVEVFYISENE